MVYREGVSRCLGNPSVVTYKLERVYYNYCSYCFLGAGLRLEFGSTVDSFVFCFMLCISLLNLFLYNFKHHYKYKYLLFLCLSSKRRRCCFNITGCLLSDFDASNIGFHLDYFEIFGYFTELINLPSRTGT